MPITLCHLYRELGKEYEARLLYAGLANHSVALSEAYHFWRPHNLQDAANLWERTKHPEKAQLLNQRAVEAWEKMKGDRDYDPIEKAWLYEEVGYIYEKTGKFETAMTYYQKAKSKYERAYTSKYLASTESNQVDGDWERYKGHFILQIPDFRLINFDSDSSQGNDCRRIKYRILNLKEQMK